MSQSHRSGGPVLSVLDMVPVSAGRTRRDALEEMVDLARCAEAAGYRRYWLAEHHGSTTYLSSATTVLMGQVLAATERIGVCSGGIMLPNHAPLVIAEQIGTLATLHPSRVGLGLGRAPGTDRLTAAALRRRNASPRHFVEEILEILTYLGAVPQEGDGAVPGSLLLGAEAAAPSASATSPTSPAAAPGGQRSCAIQPGAAGAGTPTAGAPEGTAPEGPLRAAPARVRAIPGEGTAPAVWILGSSVNGARVAGSLGLPFAVASHFAPSQAGAAITSYRSVFDAQAPTSQGCPRIAAAVNAVVAPTAQEADLLFSTAMAAAARIIGARPGPLDPPDPAPGAWRALAPGREAMVEGAMALSYVGAPDDVAAGLRDLAARWDLDEILVVCHVHDAAARRRSYELLAQAMARPAAG
ncbi:MsnO8 family LLM class oxidoreductase [Actinomyces bowdenii]|uniref:MsnO8 family LLM class oxidoreductase n=1 Tax=Actinomyces bowdenii TaxID=131109 RepID=A0A3P1V861_9ACTO|nr:MsnO8 family LLM class oxidoreductase [Actinomyces bowdenii]MBO3725384.1 MsnO8 family LLM class oxidoreductase [Actinomyces bowdenii]RRD29545.1 MsnO8 family LLM class oxidoreductase [Actinomyces bowdenii]